MKPIEKRQCLHCYRLFTPDARNVKRQKFCNEPACKKASKAESQRMWLSKNLDYFKGIDNVERVQEWRRNNPGPPKTGARRRVLQDICPPKCLEQKGITEEISAPQSSLPLLQDVCLSQYPVLIGIIAHFTGLVLQDEIAEATLRLAQLGQNVINGLPLKPQGGPEDDKQIPNPSRSCSHPPKTVQLAGSPPGQ